MAMLRRDAEFTEYVHTRTLWLRRIAYLLCQDWHRADDLTQAAFLKLYLRWDRARKVDNFDAYVRAILVNTFLNEQQTTWWKRISLHRSDPAAVEAIAETAGAAVAADGIAGIDGTIDLLSALATVPPRQRAALVLRYYCDLSVAETAALLDCSPGTVKSQSAGGLDTLRLAFGVKHAR
jgi:RNA polymerase sigma-70 factor (sigma-E family)